jgi:hypothetical protein
MCCFLELFSSKGQHGIRYNETHGESRSACDLDGFYELWEKKKRETRISLPLGVVGALFFPSATTSLNLNFAEMVCFTVIVWLLEHASMPFTHNGVFMGFNGVVQQLLYRFAYSFLLGQFSERFDPADFEKVVVFLRGILLSIFDHIELFLVAIIVL